MPKKKYEVDLSRSEINYLIDQWIFKKRDRDILKDRFDGLTFEALAEKYDLSVRQTKNIVYHAMEKLIKHI